ncbi:amino acid ABC transporter permease [Bacillus massiliigorillae]|uniref:amino acid ABC transporter permease n=1 Tax=Bacillus massiliigorillae TaxID=1243664 RepID=UPI0003AA330C|nr:amino acid ABC transporter permease [Bacillus massiliigorillae]
MPVFDMTFAIEHFPEVLKGVPITLLIAAVSIVIGSLFGLGMALSRIYRVPILNQCTTVFVSFIRGTPLLVQLYVFFYGIPELLDWVNATWETKWDADNISPLWYAFIVYSMNAAAYTTEIFRASLNSISAGQMEACHSVGMTTWQGLRRVVFPQMIVMALPNMGNIFINLIKSTSLAFAVKVVEIMAISKMIANQGYNFLEMYLVASIIYWIVCLLLELIFYYLEKNMSAHKYKPTTITG